MLQNSFQKRIGASDYFNKINEIKKHRESNLFLSLNLDERKLIKQSDQNSTLELVNFGRNLSGKKEFINFSEYEEYVIEDEFIMDAEIDQSLKVLVELIELES